MASSPLNDVQRAKQDQERLQNEANAYRNDIVPRANGEAARALPHGIVIVDDKYLAHDAQGNVKWKHAPGRVSASSQSLPPCASTSERLMANPMPTPVALVL